MDLTKDEMNLLEFLKRHPNQWHSFNDDRRTVNAVIALSQRDGIEENLEISDESAQMYYHQHQ